MKKIIIFIGTALMIMSMSITAFAGEMGMNKGESKEIDVKAKAVYTLPEDMHISDINGGKAEITTTSGAKITVFADGNILEGLKLNVIEMVADDAEAYGWISEVMKDKADKFTAYDIYFTDSQHRLVKVSGNVTVTVTTPDGYTSPKTFHISTDEKVEEVDSKQINGNTEFVASTFSYYAIADKATNNDNNGGTTNPINPTEPSNPDVPKTGDNSNIQLYAMILLATVSMIVILEIKRRKSLEK